MTTRYKKLGEILIENGVLSEEKLKAALAIQKEESGLIGEILLKHGFESEKDIVDALIRQREYIFVKEESPTELRKRKILIFITSIFLTIFFLSFALFLSIAKRLDLIFYGVLLNAQYKLMGPPQAAKDVVLITIDNETIENMPYPWPYPRTDFVTVLENLKKAEPAVIAFDFIFHGKADNPANISLQDALKSNDRIVTAGNINQQSGLNFSNILSGDEANVGVITKLQDSDEVIRRCLTYLVSSEKDNSNKAFLSWEMQILKLVNDINLKSFEPEDDILKFRNQLGKKWVIPVDEDTKSFLIRFRARAADFRRISFYKVLKGNFDPWLVRDKILIVGIASALLQDVQHTSVGWMPGIALNANAFLTLYTRNFIKNTPKYLEWIVLLVGVMLGTFFITTMNAGKAIVCLSTAITSFLLLSYILLLHGYIWSYSLFIFLTPILPWISKKLIDHFRPAQ